MKPIKSTKFKSNSNFEFAIRKETTFGGKIKFTPLFREKTNKLFSSFEPWTQIIKAYNKFYLWNLEDDEILLTEQDCYDHIEGYKQQLIKQNNSKLSSVELLKFEEK